MIIPFSLDYDILYDNGKPLCFIGESYLNTELHNFFKSSRDSKILRYEDIPKAQEWVDSHQFITTLANIKLKKLIIDQLAEFTPSYFSICGKKNHIGHGVDVGRGAFICDFNLILDNAVIGDHSIITTYTTLSHETNIESFCHIGPYTQVMFANVKTGCYISARTSIVGMKHNPLIITDHCNFLINSTITKNITISGTYYGNKRINYETSLDTKID